ncbi:hypothetical protein D4S03_11500, partial [bacterium]
RQEAGGGNGKWEMGKFCRPGIRLFSEKKRNKRIPPARSVLFEGFFIVNTASSVDVAGRK